jgi:hypothetical protein
MPNQKPAPKLNTEQKIQVFGYSIPSKRKPLWFSVWDYASQKSIGHVDSVLLKDITFELKKSHQYSSWGIKLNGEPNQATIIKRKQTGDDNVYAMRKKPFLFIVGYPVCYNIPIDQLSNSLDGYTLIKPYIERKMYGVAKFIPAYGQSPVDAKPLDSASYCYISINKIMASNLR